MRSLTPLVCLSLSLCSLHSFSTDRVADIIARARATTTGLKGESKGDGAASKGAGAASGIAMTAPRRNPFTGPKTIADQQAAAASVSLLATDSEDELEPLPSRRRGDGGGTSLLERFEASGITRRAPVPQAAGRARAVAGTEVDSEISSPMHSAPSTPLREKRRPRYKDSDGEEEG
jgi:hypothetical protein